MFDYQKLISLVLDTTYYNKEHKNLIENFVGKSYTLFEALNVGELVQNE